MEHQSSPPLSVSALATGSMVIILSAPGTSILCDDNGALKVIMRVEQIVLVIEGIVPLSLSPHSHCCH